MTLRAVLFDADGVLLDSLSSHLKICEDKAREYGLALTIPDAAALKQMARKGVVISPMVRFFRAVGFSPELAEVAERDYQETFMKRYAPLPFPGVRNVLEALRAMNLRLGIVTANVRANVVAALGDAASLFEHDGIFASDNVPHFSKPRALELAMRALHVAPRDTLYVGDQRADWSAAEAAGAEFLGVAYGWGLSEEDWEFPVVRTVQEIPSAVETLARSSSR